VEPRHLILVHGAWHNGESFAQLREELEHFSITTSTVELASASTLDESPGDLYRDADLVRKAIDDVGTDCFVLAHSYGGLPVTEGLVGAGNVQGLIFLTAFVLDEGESLFEACGSQDPPWWQRTDDGQRVVANDPESIFYNTCPLDVANVAAAALRTQSISSFTQPITQCSWKEFPSTYIVCLQDQAIPLVAQEAMAERTNARREIDTDHSPFLSAPSTLARLISEIMATPS
jgi:Alpha/beta hydrolase family